MQAVRKSEQSEFRILLVEDNLADVRLTEEAMKDASLPVTLDIENDGESALAFLLHCCQKSRHKLPDLILLDLNLPKIDGRELLALIKQDSRLKHIPVIVLSTSAAENDITQAYNAHCNCYLTKPVDFDDFSTLIQAIKSFWLSMVSLPSR